MLEARSNQDKNIKSSAYQQVKQILKNNNVDNIYVSFRDSLHVSDVNPKNEFNTPTGFYCYPLSYYKKFFSTTYDIESFTEIFPFGFERKYIIFFIPNSSAVIIENQSKSELMKYADLINSKFSNPGVNTLFNKYMKNDYTPSYIPDQLEDEEWMDSWYNEAEPTPITPKDDAHEFWLFIYDCCSQIKHYDSKYYSYKENALFTIICNAIGINGFCNSKNQGWIHINEPSQAVFFKVKNLGRVLHVDTKEKGFEEADDLVDKISKDPKAYKKLPITVIGRLSNDDIYKLIKEQPSLFNSLIKHPNFKLDKDKLTQLSKEIPQLEDKISKIL